MFFSVRLLGIIGHSSWPPCASEKPRPYTFTLDLVDLSWRSHSKVVCSGSISLTNTWIRDLLFRSFETARSPHFIVDMKSLCSFPRKVTQNRLKTRFASTCHPAFNVFWSWNIFDLLQIEVLSVTVTQHYHFFILSKSGFHWSPCLASWQPKKIKGTWRFTAAWVVTFATLK